MSTAVPMRNDVWRASSRSVAVVGSGWSLAVVVPVAVTDGAAGAAFALVVLIRVAVTAAVRVTVRPVEIRLLRTFMPFPLERCLRAFSWNAPVGRASCAHADSWTRERPGREVIGAEATNRAHARRREPCRLALPRRSASAGVRLDRMIERASEKFQTGCGSADPTLRN